MLTKESTRSPPISLISKAVLRVPSSPHTYVSPTAFSGSLAVKVARVPS
jgi:hypothetical protein